MSPVSERIDLIADLFMGVANADAAATQAQRVYIRQQLEDLLRVEELPPTLQERLARFDAASFDVDATARALASSLPMRARRLLELVAFVAVADGDLGSAEDEYIRHLGNLFGLSEDDYRDLTLDHESRGPRRTFTNMAVVKVPDPVPSK